MNVNPMAIKDEIDKVKASIQDHKRDTFSTQDSLNKKLNDFIDRTNHKVSQLSSVVDLLIKENQEIKAILANQRFVIQPVNPFQGNAVNQGSQSQSSSAGNALNINLPDSFLPSSTIPQQQNGHQSDATQQSTQAQQQSAPQQQRSQQSQSSGQHGSHQPQQSQHHRQQQHQQQQQQAAAAAAAAAAAQNGVLDGALGDATTNSGMLRFINNQYVDDEQSLTAQGGHAASHAAARGMEFVFMDPSRARSHFRSNSGNFGDANQDEDGDADVGSPIGHLSPAGGSRLQKSMRHGEYDAENYDLIIHNDFNKVEDVYYEYYNSLKPQVERVQKAYKIKKIRKYQKIKALAVRVDRYKELKGCSLAESFQFFDNLRIAEDNTKRSIAWLYNTLPDILKKIGLEDQLKRNSGN